MQGGKILGQGEDTCVISPATTCPGVPLDPKQLSRLVDPNSGDAITEQIILRSFPKLVHEGFVSSSVAQCNISSSQLTADDLSGPVTQNGCKSAMQRQANNRGHVNLITNRYDGTAAKLMFSGTDIQKRELLSSTAIIATHLVQDNGPWIIETDLHYNNIGYVNRLLCNGKYAIMGCIADWGRALYITNPNDFKEVRIGIERWCSGMIQKGFGDTTEEVLNVYADNKAFDFPQHRNLHMKIIRDGYRHGSTSEQKTACVNALRGWMMHSVLSADRFDISLLTNANQHDQAVAGNKRYPSLLHAYTTIKAILNDQPIPQGTPSMGQIDPAAPAAGLPKQPGIIVVPGANIAIPSEPAKKPQPLVFGPPLAFGQGPGFAIGQQPGFGIGQQPAKKSLKVKNQFGNIQTPPKKQRINNSENDGMQIDNPQQPPDQNAFAARFFGQGPPQPQGLGIEQGPPQEQQKKGKFNIRQKPQGLNEEELKRFYGLPYNGYGVRQGPPQQPQGFGQGPPGEFQPGPPGGFGQRPADQNPFPRRFYDDFVGPNKRYGGQEYSRSSTRGRRLLSLPTRRAPHFSSSKKRRYTHRRRALLTGKAGYRPTKTGRKV